ncbi:response regulator transcription factor [Thioclava sp.]|uniref:response regulator transcription factor n=1 Tax=Thioclava sp. TaxID=1933450 RepID=UPI003242D3FE
MVIRRTIIVVDDNRVARKTLCDLLASHGWNVQGACNALEMTKTIIENRVDLVILDISLGQSEGLRHARAVREQHDIPVVLISSHCAPLERAQWLEAGVDDYVVKPFDHRELLMRVQRVLNRYVSHSDSKNTISFRHNHIDLASGAVVHNDGRIEKLTSFETTLLKLFLTHADKVLSRDDICSALYGRSWSPYDRSIDIHVARLRRKIETKGEAPTSIRSVRCVGYVLSSDALRGA